MGESYRGEYRRMVRCMEIEGFMDTGIIIAIVGSAVAIIGVVVSMMFWVRQEANDIRKDQKEDRKDILLLIRSIESEMKDFHDRLLEIEKSRK
jgi:hypothetical protein